MLMLAHTNTIIAVTLQLKCPIYLPIRIKRKELNPLRERLLKAFIRIASICLIKEGIQSLRTKNIQVIDLFTIKNRINSHNTICLRECLLMVISKIENL